MRDPDRPQSEATCLARLEAYLGSRYSPQTIAAFRRQAGHFLRSAGVKPGYTRDDILTYIDQLIKGGYKPQSIKVMLFGVRALFRAMGMAWPLDRRDTHLGLPEGEKNAPVLLPSEVALLIMGTRRGNPLDKAIACLSTVYGLRNSELALVMSEGMAGYRLEVQTAKVGTVRSHGIPKGIGPILTFPPIAMGRDRVHDVFDQLMTRHVRPPRAREGWHSVRRSLVTSLVEAKVDPYTVTRYMGWKIKDVAFIYFKPPGSQIDADVYKLHPFLPYWLEGVRGGN